MWAPYINLLVIQYNHDLLSCIYLNYTIKLRAYVIESGVVDMLSDRDIKKLAQEKQIIVPFIESNCSGATADLTLSKIASIQLESKDIIVLSQDMKEFYKEIDISCEDLILNPGSSALIQTHETLSVPVNLSARIFPRYGVTMMGLNISEVYLNPGYRGIPSFLITNHSKSPIQLIAGLRIVQICFYRLSSESDKPYPLQEDAKYLDEKTISTPKIHLDREVRAFLEEKGVTSIGQGVVKDLNEFLVKEIDDSSNRLVQKLLAKFDNRST